MGSVSYKLEGFEGPLDLLLFLISKHKLNINDIQISLLLEQYLEYIDGLEEYDFEYAGEFLEMAARLILIKTLSLLPKHEEAEQMKKELQGRLIEYSVCKEAAKRLGGEYVGDKVFVKKATLPEADKAFKGSISVDKLTIAYIGLSDKKSRQTPVEASVFRPIVSHKIVSVTTGVITVLRRLYKTGRCSLGEVLEGVKGKSERIAVFLAVLELTKSGRIALNEDNSEITFSGRRRSHAVQ